MEPSPAQAGASDRDRSPPPPPPPPPQSSAAAAVSSPLAVVCSFWKDFDLEKERSGLDEQGLKIAENQETSQKNRRKLAENTRDFKKASSDEKLGLFNSLLKSYQEEVDNLTKRAKFGENAFLNIYQKLYEAPDPYPALASMADQDQKLSELETENRKMKLELEEYRAEAAHLKNQQATIRRLEERNRQLEQQMEEKVREMVEMKQRSMAEDSQKTLEALKDRERSLQDQLRQATESVKNMQKLHESAQSQLFELRTQSEEDRTAKEAEVSLLMDEVERAQARLVSLEREKGDLRSQLQTTNEDATKSSDYLESSDILESSLNAKEKIISELNAELRNIESTLSSEREMHVNELKKLTALLTEKESALMELMKELQERPTQKLVDDLKKKVQILQAVGYNSIEAEDWELATNGEEMSKLEALLLDKNRKMEHELTQLKVKISEKTSLLEEAEKRIAELTSKVEEQQKLILKLEDDILKVVSHAPLIKLLSEYCYYVDISTTKKHGYSSTDRRASLLNDWDLQEIGSSEASEGTDPRHASLDQDQNSMLKVICNQRDRFRARLRETEEELRKLKEKYEMLTVELEKTKADNVQLYGKIRYVQDYSHDKIVSRGPKKYAEDIESGSSDVEAKYKKMYEDDINPFAAFSKKEKDQRYKELGLRDKITLSSGRFLLEHFELNNNDPVDLGMGPLLVICESNYCSSSFLKLCSGHRRYVLCCMMPEFLYFSHDLGWNERLILQLFISTHRYARTFIFFYSIGLHLLVFTLLYRMSALSYLNTTPGHDEIILDAGNQTLSHML
ncbi:Protein CASP [Dichanthelium oligosanthes]|nr:Protein CASP [Dichanthelium oligosanthes]